MKKESVYKTTEKVIPQRIRQEVKRLLVSYGYKGNTDVFIGFILGTGILAGLLGGFFLSYLTGLPFWIFFIAGVVGTILVVYLWLKLVFEKRMNLIEQSLPDALQLIASNLRAGMTSDKAILFSARPEFGPLKEEINIIGRKITMGYTIREALLDMTSRWPSKRLLRAVQLINSGLDSGGSFANLLEATANHLKEQFLIDKKIKASISMYVIFIFVAASLITPILLSLSTVLTDVLRTTLTQVSIPNTSAISVPIQQGGNVISAAFLMTYIVLFLIVNSFMASRLLGLIGKGKQIQGIFYFIPMILIAIPSFFIIQHVARILLAGLINF